MRSYGSWEEVKKTAGSERIKGDERILGDSGFVQRILSGERLSPRTRQSGVSLDALAARVGDLYDVAIENLCSKNRRSHLVEARSLFCFWAVRHGGFPVARVAAFLNMTPPGVGYAAERGERIAHNKGYAL